MSMTRGPLPPGIYWRRRLFVVGVVAAVVLLAVVLIRGGGAEERSADVTASRSGAETTPTDDPSEGADTTESTDPADPTDPAAPGTSQSGKGGALSLFGPSTPPLATPVGRCADSDIVIEPSAKRPVAGGTVPLTLSVQTEEAEACTWEVSARHLALTITRDGEEIWTSRECPGLIPNEDLVVRRAVASELVLSWSGRRSVRDCVRSDWVEPGTLQLDAAAYGGEPGSAEIELKAPRPDVVEVPEPAETDDQTGTSEQGNQADQGRSSAQDQPRKNQPGKNDQEQRPQGQDPQGQEQDPQGQT